MPSREMNGIFFVYKKFEIVKYIYSIIKMIINNVKY